MSRSFSDAIKNRRTYYAIGKETAIPADRVKQAVEHALQHTPSAFNAQSARVVLLFGEHHDKLWGLTRETLQKIVPEDRFKPTDEKIRGFAAGSGSVLYFEDAAVTKNLQEQFPLYQEHFPVWAQQANGMLQLVVWTALEDAGLGASLQHYNPVIDVGVKKQWNIPDSWQLVAQMPFGAPTGQPGDKAFAPIHTRMKVFG